VARRRLAPPALSGAATMVVLAVLGLRSVAAVLAFGLAAFVLVANAGEILRGVRAFARATGARGVRALFGAFGKNRRLYGGLVAHLGIAVAAIAVTASSAFALQTEVTLARGQSTSFAGYTLRYEGEHALHQPQRVVLVADVTVTRDGAPAGRLTPSLNRYPSSTDPIPTPSIHYGVLKDLYSSVTGFEEQGNRATFRFFLNPGVMWLWVGGFVIAFGGLLAAGPSRRRSVATVEPPAVARAPAEVG
jgi:cytochrome c-type biogenesis protein CcmF